MMRFPRLSLIYGWIRKRLVRLRIRHGVKLVRPTITELLEFYERNRIEYMRKRMESLIISYILEDIDKDGVVKMKDIKLEWKPV